MPENKQELWELKLNNEITYVQLWDDSNRATECPSYEVVTMLLRGWNFQPWEPSC